MLGFRMFNMKIIPFSLLALCLNLFSACANIPPIGLKSPSLSFSELSIKDISFSDIKFQVVVKADNPNDVDIPLSNLKFDLNLLGQAFATGQGASNNLTLARKVSSDVPINFTIPTVQLIDTVRKLKLSDLSALSYQLKGSANWGESTVFSIPFERNGNVEAFKKMRDILGPLLRLP